MLPRDTATYIHSEKKIEFRSGGRNQQTQIRGGLSIVAQPGEAKDATLGVSQEEYGLLHERRSSGRKREQKGKGVWASQG